MRRWQFSSTQLAGAGAAVAAIGVALGFDWAFVGGGLSLLVAAGVRSRSRDSSPHAVAVVIQSLLFVLVGIGFTFASVGLLAAQRYVMAIIFIPGLLIGPYFAFLGYATLWQALTGARAPYADQISSGVARFGTWLSRDI